MLSLVFPAVYGWNTLGHDSIGMTIMSDIKGKTLNQLKKLLGGHDAVDVSGWAHKADDKYPWASKLHFQEQDKNDDCSRTDFEYDCSDNMCLVPAIKHFYGHVHGTITTKINFPGDVTFTDADSVKFLINLISDMHQPLHMSNVEWRNTRVKWKDSKQSLFTFWDDSLTQAAMEDEGSAWYSEWTVIAAVRSRYEDEKKAFQDEGFEALLKKWAQENAQKACEYFGELKDAGDKDSDGDYVISQELYSRWKKEMMRSRILMAGARIAIVLESLLHKVDHELSKGSGLDIKKEHFATAELDAIDPDQEDRRGVRQPEENYFQNFCINAVLGVIVVTAFYFIVVRDGVTRRMASKYV